MMERNRMVQPLTRRLAVMLAALSLLLGVGITASSVAQAGPSCSSVCGTVVNRSNYNVGIGVLFNAYSNYPYDAIVYPGQSSSRYAPDVDKVYAGTGWCIDGWNATYPTSPSFHVKGPGWSGNLTDWLSPYRLWAYPCSQSGSW